MVCANLPFLEDGDKKISQMAARKSGLMAEDPDDLVRCEMVEQEMMDLRNRLSATCYDPYMVLLPGDKKK